MRNPWLDIPLRDYEGHMALPGIAQAQMLGDVFEQLLRQHSPGSVAVFGCAGGNGFERIQPETTRRVVGVDINESYLAQAAARFRGRFEQLDLIAADLEGEPLGFEPVDLIYAGLVFEYVDVGTLVDKARALLNPNGVLGCVIQLAGESAKVTPSPFTTLTSLSSVSHLVAPATLQDAARERGFALASTQVLASPSGKQFQAQTFLWHHPR